MQTHKNAHSIFINLCLQVLSKKDHNQIKNFCESVKEHIVSWMKTFCAWRSVCDQVHRDLPDYRVLIVLYPVDYSVYFLFVHVLNKFFKLQNQDIAIWMVDSMLLCSNVLSSFFKVQFFFTTQPESTSIYLDK